MIKAKNAQIGLLFLQSDFYKCYNKYLSYIGVSNLSVKYEVKPV